VSADLVPIVLVALAIGIFLAFVRRKNELFCVSVRGGRALLVRGRIPPTLMGDVRDIVRTTRHGTVRAIKRDRGVLVLLSGEFDANTAQKLRNAISIVPPQRLRTAPPIARPTVGQVLGIAWLAWRHDSRR
jgi:hypothetical protein